MPKSTDERKTLELIKNHGEFKSTLIALSMSGDLNTLESHVLKVTQKWFDLARMHLLDATAVDVKRNSRSVYSRSYYAAYNASKAVRYFVSGFVSLRGDDHKKVGELPGNFPDVDTWLSNLSLLYEHRLRADYDNWAHTASENILTPSECLVMARKFIEAAEQFLHTEYKLKL